MKLNQKQIKILVYSATIFLGSIPLVILAMVTFSIPTGWFEYLIFPSLILMVGVHFSPWGKMVRSLPEEQAKRTPRKRMAMILAATVLLSGILWWLSYNYVADWQYRSDAAKAKELYRKGDYKAAWPYIHKSFSGQDPEVWYMLAVNSLAAPQDSPTYQIAVECLQNSAETGFEPAMKLWDFYRQLNPELPEREKYLSVLIFTAKNGDPSTQNMLAAWRQLEQNSPQTEIHIATGNKAVQLLKDRFPQCLAGFRRTLLKPMPFPQGHGGAHLEYGLNCPCGGKRFNLGGFRITDEKEAPLSNFLSPLSLNCLQCGKTIPMFDDCRDGYDAQLVDDVAKNLQIRNREKREPIVLKGEYEIIISLEYGLDDDELKPGSELEKKLPDIFTWISVYGKDSGGKLQLLFEWECA